MASMLRNFRVRQSPSFATEVAGALRVDIERGLLQAGDRLPTEQEIGGKFGVSRAVVREAISILKHDGLIESFQGRGSFVSAAPLAATYRLPEPNLEDEVELAQIIEFLIANEVAATRLAALRRTDAALAEIRQALEGMQAAIANNLLGVDEDVQFHAAIFRATRNPFFISFCTFLDQRVRKLIRTARTNTARFKGLSEKVQAEHQAIYDAIESRRADAASEAAEAHLRNAAERLRIYRSPEL